jgi:hypothetical protein
MESHSITVNPIIEENGDLPIEEGVQSLDDPIECNVCTNILGCLCVMCCLFMVFIMLGGFYAFLTPDRSDDSA